MMSQSDEFDLRELLGDGTDPDLALPSIEDTPASELATIDLVEVVEKTHEQLYPHGCPARCERCVIRLNLKDARVEATKQPNYILDGHNIQEHLAHPIPEPPAVEIDSAPAVILSPDLKDEAGQLDEEYHATFNATIAEVKDLEPEALQELRHRLDRMIRRAKIQQRAIRVTEEGKLQFIEEKRRKAIRQKDTEFQSKRSKEQEEAKAGGSKPKAASKKSDSGMSAAEKQVKQFCKLMMDEATIRTTLAAVGTPIPENLAEMIAKHRK
jgi:hypothetical protein